MPEILDLSGDCWSLCVWTRDNETPEGILSRTLFRRGKELPSSAIRVSPPETEIECPAADRIAPGVLLVPKPLLFENRLYEFDFQFSEAVECIPEPRVLHRLASISEGFHRSGRSLRGSINFGNNIGWFRLGLRFVTEKMPVEFFLSFEVFPTKMDMKDDLGQISRMVDRAYPLWLFSFTQKTEQELAASRKPHERFPLLWLAFFQSLREELIQAVKVITRSPHSRLVSRDRLVLLEKIKGVLSPKLEEEISEQAPGGERERRYRIETRKISIDTPENRFVKMVLVKSIQNLQIFARRDFFPKGESLSPYFFQEMKRWISGLEKCLSDPLFRVIGDYQGFLQESLVLQKKPGYSKIYRIWQDLKLYLELMGRSASISMKSIAELYEVWCLLEIRNILLDLGFQEEALVKPSLRNTFFEKELVDGGGAAFRFQRTDGLKIHLSHEPIFYKPKDNLFNVIYSLTTVQKPDIFLEVLFRDGKRMRWIFDAKYRLSQEEEGIDLIPDDALNQMHRYRDALIHLSQSGDGGTEKSRPVVGAFVLYPGWIEEEKNENPYAPCIEEVGIGGFPLLPGRENLWLRAFMRDMLGEVTLTGTVKKAPDPDEHLLRGSIRIAPTDLVLSRYKDLTLVASMAERTGRDPEYIKRFLHGNARWYHIPVSTAENYKVSRTVMREICRCAVAVSNPGIPDRRIEFLYDVLAVQMVQRNELTLEQAGKVDRTNSSPYWLFELGTATMLRVPVIVPGIRRFRFMLTGARDLMESKEWKDLPDRYSFLRNR